MKSVPAATYGKMTGAVVRPIYLYDLTLDQRYLYSSQGNITFNDKLWVSGDVDLVAADAGSARLRIRNDRWKWSADAWAGRLNLKPVEIWWGYGVDEYTDLYSPGVYDEGIYLGPVAGVPNLLFSGLTASVTDIGDFITIECTRESPSRFPTESIRAPFANHLTATGTVITFGGQSVQIEGGK